MELFRNRRPETDEPLTEEDIQDEMAGETIESRISDDGTRLNYTLRMADGSIREMALPTRLLGARFTVRGVEYLDEDH